MTNANRSILRKFTKAADEPYNILLFNLPHLEKYNYLLAQTGHNFYLWTENYKGQWSYNSIAKPDNVYHLADHQQNFDPAIDFDMVICHGRLQQMDIAYNICHSWHIPLICIHHDYATGTVISDNGLPGKIEAHRMADIMKLQGHINVSDSESVAHSWQAVGKIIKPGIDTFFFTAKTQYQSPPTCLWQPAADNNINNFVVQNLSPLVKLIQLEPSMNQTMLCTQYDHADLFLNLDAVTVNISLLEAMSCGLIPITLANPNFDLRFTATQPQNLPTTVQVATRLSLDKLSEEGKKSRLQAEALSNKYFVNEWIETFTQAASIIYQR